MFSVVVSVRLEFHCVFSRCISQIGISLCFQALYQPARELLNEAYLSATVSLLLLLHPWLVPSSGAKIINVFRAWIGAQLTICAQK